MESKKRVSERQARGWNECHDAYVCVDEVSVEVRVRTAVGDEETGEKGVEYEESDDYWQTANRIELGDHNRLRHGGCRVTVSGVTMSRDMKEITASSGGTRTIIFPKTVRRVANTAFSGTISLRAAVVNEGLEALGDDENADEEGEEACGVFKGSAMEKVSLPSTLGRIGDNAFESCEHLRHVTFPEGLEKIGKYCFQHSGLEEAVFPDSVTEIEQGAFYECHRLRQVVFGRDSRLEKIGVNAFACTNIDVFIAPLSLRTVSQGAFNNCQVLKRVILNEGLEVLGTNERPDDEQWYYGIFQGSAVESVSLPSTLKRIEYSAFRNCKHLKSVALPKGLEKIGEGCFCESGIEQAVIPDGVVEIPKNAFGYCENLKSVVFGENSRLQKICINAFFEAGLEEFVAPPSLRVLSQGAFRKSALLKRVVLNEGLEVLGVDEYPGNGNSYYGVFQESAVESVSLPSTLKRIEYDAFKSCKNLKHITLPDSLEKIGAGCFCESGIEQVVIPDSVVEISENAFNSCGNLKSVVFGENSRLQKIGIGAFNSSGLEEFTAPPGLRTIAQAAFAKCERLKRVTLNEGLETLGTDEYPEDGKRYYGVFQDSAIEEVTLPSTLRRIEYNTFKSCASLKFVSFHGALDGTLGGSLRQDKHGLVQIPKSVVEIGYGAFFKCVLLSKVEFEEGSALVRIGNHSFQKCTNLRQLVLEEGSKLEKVGSYAFKETGLESFVAPDSLKEIGTAAFCGCEKLARVELNEGLESVGWFCFSATPLKELRLPEKISASKIDVGVGRDYKTVWVLEDREEIGDAREEGADTEVVVVPASARAIRAEAFSGLKDLRRVIFQPGSQLGVIEREAFRECGLEEIELPRSIKKIGEEAFRGCESLMKVGFEEGSALQRVGRGAFAGTPLRSEDVSFPANADASGAFDCEDASE